MKNLFRKITVLLLITLISVFSVGCISFNETQTIPPNNSFYAAEDVNFNVIDKNERSPMSLVDAVDKVKNACVKILVETYVDDKVAATSTASGTIVDISRFDKDGGVINQPNVYYILTCHHVIKNMGKVTVTLPDEYYAYGNNEDYSFTGWIDDTKETKAKSQEVYLVGGDSVSDVAVLKLVVSQAKIDRGVRVTSVKVADSKSSTPYTLRVGEQVFAIGNPTGDLPGTVTDGIISYVNRQVTFEEVGLLNCIQHNVNITDGSSGGALFNMYGELVGITNGGSLANKWINYAIPMQSYFDVNNQKYVTKREMTEHGLTCEDRGFISTAERLISTETADNYGYIKGRWSLGITVGQRSVDGTTSALVVINVVKGSISEKAGIKKDDIIVSVTHGDDITQVSTTATFSSVISKLKNTLTSESRTMFALGILRETVTQSFAIVLDPDVPFIFCDTNNVYLYED